MHRMGALCCRHKRCGVLAPRGAVVMRLCLLGAAVACQPVPRTGQAGGEAASPAAASARVDPVPAKTPSPAAPSVRSGPAAPAARESLPEPATPAAATSPQAAATLVETYFALLQSRATAEADALWGNHAQAAGFRAQFEVLGRPQVEVDSPGGPEGAAGSIYVTVPVRFIAPPASANPRPRMGEVAVRRVNDVPGATRAQRRWHIERIDVAMTPK